MKYSPKEKQLVSHYMFCKGHACVDVVGDEIRYLDRTKGLQVAFRTVDVASVLEKVHDLDILTIQGLVDYENGLSTDNAEFYRKRRGLSSLTNYFPLWNLVNEVYDD